MYRKVHISLLLCTLGILTAQAQWTAQDSVRLRERLNGEGELKVNAEAVNAIRFDFLPEAEKVYARPRLAEDKPWMDFRKDLPRSYTDTTRLVRRGYIRLLPYTAFTRWNEDPLAHIRPKTETDSLRHFKITFQLSGIKPDPSKMNGHVDVPAGMDPTITPSNSPVVGGMDIDKFFYENFTKSGRTKRRNRKRAKAWKTYKDYIPTKQDTTRKDTLLMKELLLRQAEELYPPNRTE